MTAPPLTGSGFRLGLRPILTLNTKSVFIADVCSKRKLPLAAREFEAGLAPPASDFCKPHQTPSLGFALRARLWLSSDNVLSWTLPCGRMSFVPFRSRRNGRSRLKPAMLRRAIRGDSAMPYIGLENALTKPIRQINALGIAVEPGHVVHGREPSLFRQALAQAAVTDRSLRSQPWPEAPSSCRCAAGRGDGG